MASEQKTVQNSESSPWGPAQDSLKALLAKIGGTFNGGGGTPGLSGFGGGPESGIPGSGGGGMGGGVGMFTPTQSDWTKQAYQMIADAAGKGSGTSDAANSWAQGILGGNQSGPLADYASGKYVNGGSPEFLKALDTQSGQLATDIARQYSGGAGRYGTAMTSAIAQGVGDVRTKAIADEIAREQGLQMNALGMQGQLQTSAAGLAPSLEASRYLPGQMLQGIGASQDAFNWAKQQAPYEALKAQLGLTLPIAGAGGSQTSTTTQPTNPFLTILGALLGGGQLLSGFGR